MHSRDRAAAVHAGADPHRSPSLGRGRGRNPDPDPDPDPAPGVRAGGAVGGEERLKYGVGEV